MEITARPAAAPRLCPRATQTAPTPRPTTPTGPAPVHSINGNVIVPAAPARARKKRDRPAAERVMAFFAALPKEPENKIQRMMLPRIFGAAKPPKLDFRTQQGLLQMYTDWCEPNPSCRNCFLVQHLGTGLPTPASTPAARPPRCL